jgi:concanavalin A-like lectin/glucanase superfamily protein
MGRNIRLGVTVLIALLSLTISRAARATTLPLLAYLPLNGNLDDVSGNGNNGSVPSGDDSPTFGPGSSGGEGAVFTGTDAAQLFTLPINLNSLNEVSFGAWIKVTNTTPIRGIISDDTGNFGRTIDFDDRAGTTGISAFDGNGVFGGITPTSGFEFVAVSYNASASTDLLDVNGTFTSTTGTPPTGEAVITVGRNPNFDNPFGGTIDNLFVYGTALDEAQLNSIQTNGVNVTAPPTSTVPLPSSALTGFALLAGLAIFRVLRRPAAI